MGAFKKAPSTAQFLLERCTRIYPVLWATIAGVMLGSFLMHRETGLSLTLNGAIVLIANLLAMQNALHVPLINYAAWTLSFEFSFYIIVGLYMARSKPVSLLRRIVCIAVGLWLLTLQFRAVFFLTGLLIAGGYFENARVHALIRWPMVWLALFLLNWTLALTMLDMKTSVIHLIDAGMTEPLLPVCALLGWLCGTMALAGIAYGEGALGRLTLTKPVQWLGTISYSFYLWQALILGFFHHLLESPKIAAIAGGFAMPLFFLIALPPTLFVSALSQHYLEIRVTNWLRRLFEGSSANLKAPA